MRERKRERDLVSHRFLTFLFQLTLMKFGKERIPFGAPFVKRKNVISLSEQIQQLSLVKSNLADIKGQSVTEKLISKSLFFISTGSNDLFGYYHSNSSFSKEAFLSSLELAYEKHLKSLIELGARKFGIISIAPIGCCPSQRIYNATGGCLEDLNDLAIAFHERLDALLFKLSSQHKSIKYSLGNAFGMTINVIQNPLPFNFTQVEAACCGAGKLNAESFCIPQAKLCSNRNNYLFWDLFHPTQAASKLAAVTLYNGGPQFVYPINFAQLAKA
ncbi:GDSL esterase/lipase At5g08460-like [Prunus avium]|uniref:GDSL esterase/lipase At5g08460-like n=1 Tax=Prunus avium TaxID=42229 RepID=A0A6P5RGW6_PRUAV|nr:GDSL esterase/lipase At5g08460-like [Prunus avium]